MFLKLWPSPGLACLWRMLILSRSRQSIAMTNTVARCISIYNVDQNQDRDPHTFCNAIRSSGAMSDSVLPKPLDVAKKTRIAWMTPNIYSTPSDSRSRCPGLSEAAYHSKYRGNIIH